MTSAYFELDPVPSDLSGWTALRSLRTDSQALRRRVEVTRMALGTPQWRVAASIDFLGLAARLVSPVLLSAVRDHQVPVLSDSSMWIRTVAPGPARLAWRVPARRPATARAVLDNVVTAVLMPLASSYSATFAVSPKVLRGNIASALNGAVVMLPEASTLVTELLGLDELVVTVRRTPPQFVRNSCCLYYRVPGAGICGDCVLKRV